MTSPYRTRKLREALALLRSASPDELGELFQDQHAFLDEIKQRLDEPENRFTPHSSDAYRAIDTLVSSFRRLTGYNAGWIPEKLLEHCCHNAGRPQKYGRDLRETNCVFIAMMVERGSSETQAMKLLMRLRGDAALTSGHLRELQDSYRDFKRIGLAEGDRLSIYRNSHIVSQFLKFDISNLEGEDAASQKAVHAFRSLFRDLIGMMKASHGMIERHDNAYPDIFGCVLDWVKSEYEDPLDYFFAHPSHQSVPYQKRRRALNEYINTMFFYMENPRL